ncbi:MAG: DNA polymerase III subunit gamma/tau [Lachnospiraceae bacterium]|nr:DNA polymerase III subunit gamma/tau [Lachnospiraceae bacterium]
MAYQSLYRKYRPQRFSDVVGQEPITKAIGSQVTNDRLAHAYLFTGTRGTGKTTVAKILARAVNCSNVLEDGSPCGECEICRGISDGTLMNVIEIDAASNNGVDDVRTIIEEISYRPQSGKKKVYIIDEVHNLSLSAFNALLKTIEEPPDYALFILATTELGKVPITIRSRCQRYDFHRMTVDTIVQRMKKILSAEGIEADDKALGFIAVQADGSMRDALSLLDRCLAFNSGEELTYERTLDILGAVDVSVFSSFMKIISEGDLKGAIKLLDDVLMRGREIQIFVVDLISYMRNLLLISAGGRNGADISDVLGVSPDTYEDMKAVAAKFDVETLTRYIGIFSELTSEIRYSTQKRVLTEIAIVRLMQPKMQEDVASTRQRLAIIERKLDRIEREGIKTPAGSDKDSGHPDKPAKKAPLPEALPEDVKLVCDNWGRIVKNSQDMNKGILAEAQPSVRGNDLVIVCRDDVSAGSLKRSSDDLEAVLARETKKQIRFEIYGPEKGEDPEATFPDLRSMINFDEIKIVD